MPHPCIAIIGAGVVGLAIAAHVASEDKDVYVLEKNHTFGLETSARHSGVIHSGIYYPKGSLKTKMCIEGNRMLYNLCKRYDIGHSRVGKLIVATCDEEIAELQTLLDRGRLNGVEGLRLLSKREMKALEPNVEGTAAILSPSTGIIDSHALMKYFISKATVAGAQIAYRTKVVGIKKRTDGYEVIIEDDTGKSTFITRVLVNCAGLYCDKVAEMAGIDTTTVGYKLHYCKGEYYSIAGVKNIVVNKLIYPVPPPKVTGVGIHITFDLEGRMRLGPSVQYVNSIDYTIDNRHKRLFYDSAKRLLPSIQSEQLEPEMTGIRPKLQEPGGDIKDFVIRDESDQGLPGFINLIGIESPGLTSSPAIAEYVGGLIEELCS